VTPSHPRALGELATRLRLATGLILFAFVATHLANHALGVHSLGLMQEGRGVFLSLWRSLPGTILLYGSLVVHLILVLIRVWSLRTFRLPVWQVAQITFGLLVPFLLIGHVIGTRIAHELYGFRDDYMAVLRTLWPELVLRQSVLVILVWLHAVVGLHFWLRLKPAYRQLRPILLVAAVLLPVLALLGFALAGRQVEMRDQGGYATFALPAEEPEPAPAEQEAHLDVLRSAAELTYLGLVAIALSAPVARQLGARRRKALSIRYSDGNVVPIDPGMSVLDASRFAGIPHASVCGGRGRCSTCRVRVIAGAGDLPRPAPDEARVLARIGPGPDVRLACQLQPHRPVTVVPLLSSEAGPRDAMAPVDPAQGIEREVAVLFADLRAFTRMAEGRLPYDVVFILNQYFAATGQAIERAGGKVDKFIGDGVMALFGTAGDLDAGPVCRRALRAARDISVALAGLNRRLPDDLPEPLRIAIGLHVGPVILGTMGYGRAKSLTAIGDAVNVASRLEAMAKELDVELCVSERVAERAGIDLTYAERREITVRGRRRPLVVRLIGDATALPAGPQASLPHPPARSLRRLLRLESAS
jgi:adenylate cyclase